MTSLRRASERELVRGLRAGRRRALVERLRGNGSQRRAWDRAIIAFRTLEQREVSRFELEQVERWLFEDLEAEQVLAPSSRAPWRRWTYLAATAATGLAVAALALLWIGVGPSKEDRGGGDVIETAGGLTVDLTDDLTPRGPSSIARPLAIELMCGQPPRAAAQRGCELDELLGFSVRLSAEGWFEGGPEGPRSPADALGRAPLALSLFGVDANGELLYYLPTPDEPARLQVRLGQPWQALPLSVRLSVNHEPGRVRVFALAADAALQVDELDALAQALAPQPPATVDDLPWHLRVAPALLGRVCPQPERCVSAEAELRINPPGSEP